MSVFFLQNFRKYPFSPFPRVKVGDHFGKKVNASTTDESLPKKNLENTILHSTENFGSGRFDWDEISELLI